MMSTIGLYFFMSFLYLDPWHMFTSSAQYFALLPSYLCTLQIYAFCNTHDISWGTKGDNSIARDLGAARGTGQSTVELEMPSEQLDIDSCYDQALRNLRDRVEVPQPEVSAQQKQEDYYRAVRTYMVSIWLIANAILAMAVSEAYGTESAGNNGYLAFLLWAVAALAAFRAIGSAAFLVIRLIHKLAEGRRKFTAANGSGVSGHVEASTVSRSAQSKQPLAHRNAWEYTRDFITEAGWWIRRQSEKLAFWR
ncbi:Chitin synthase, class 2 [Ascosphaera aggregata]|nr:Chitin synthase, class 2 [Ascosphaera aggregata]